MEKICRTGEFYNLRWLRCGLSVESAAFFLGVCRRTIDNWEKYGRRPPEAAIAALKYRAGFMPCGSAEWQGWRFKNDLLWSPEGYGYHTGDLRSIAYLRELVKELKQNPQLLLFR